MAGTCYRPRSPLQLLPQLLRLGRLQQPGCRQGQGWPPCRPSSRLSCRTASGRASRMGPPAPCPHWPRLPSLRCSPSSTPMGACPFSPCAIWLWGLPNMHVAWHMGGAPDEGRFCCCAVVQPFTAHLQTWLSKAMHGSVP